jgi:hypothetical protein
MQTQRNPEGNNPYISTWWCPGLQKHVIEWNVIVLLFLSAPFVGLCLKFLEPQYQRMADGTEAMGWSHLCQGAGGVIGSKRNSVAL